MKTRDQRKVNENRIATHNEESIQHEGRHRVLHQYWYRAHRPARVNKFSLTGQTPDSVLTAHYDVPSMESLGNIAALAQEMVGAEG